MKRSYDTAVEGFRHNTRNLFTRGQEDLRSFHYYAVIAAGRQTLSLFAGSKLISAGPASILWYMRVVAGYLFMPGREFQRGFNFTVTICRYCFFFSLLDIFSELFRTIYWKIMHRFENRFFFTDSFTLQGKKFSLLRSQRTWWSHAR